MQAAAHAKATPAPPSTQEDSNESRDASVTAGENNGKTTTSKKGNASGGGSGGLGAKLHVDFPFRLTVEHAPLDLRGLFRVTHAFDLYEVRGAAGENVGKARKDLTVDVLEVTPTRTVIHVTPSGPFPYEQIAAEVEALIQSVAQKHLGGQAKVTKIEWIIDKTGLASDLRGRIKAVQ